MFGRERLAQVVRERGEADQVIARCKLRGHVADQLDVHAGVDFRVVLRALGDAVRCAFCSSPLRDFRARGRLGCAHCYGAFETSLRELLRRVHGNSRHAGRRYEPPRPDLLERDSTLGELRDRLRRAIESEQFELAADLRDRIRVLE